MSARRTRAEWDVAVVGGGPAGIAAALSASALGARTLLLERDHELGGNVAAAFVHTICGLYLPSDDQQAVPAHPGIPTAFAERLREAGKAGSVGWARSAGFLHIDPQAFGALAATLLDQAAGITVHTGAELRSLRLARDADDASVLEYAANGGTIETARAACVIDATGDATAAALAGAPTERARPEELQHASFIARLDDIDTDTLDAMERARTTTAVAHACRQRELPPEARSIAVRPAASAGSIWLTVNLPKPNPATWDPLDSDQIEHLTTLATQTTEELLAWLRAHRDPFARATLGATARRIGIRESRRVVGRVRLAAADVLAGTRREDEACISTWPVELWERADRLVFRAGAAPCSIPLGALIADHSGRLAMAGRCASADREALGAIRVIATSMAMGEAAGAACAMAASTGSELSEIAASDVRDAVTSGATTAAIGKANADRDHQ
jgi:2-polyprenyl-6-methoxyphenol hydroxylase-like FAD-dependent oxidoreductase